MKLTQLLYGLHPEGVINRFQNYIINIVKLMRSYLDELSMTNIARFVSLSSRQL
jgi:hypothetical protein